MGGVVWNIEVDHERIAQGYAKAGSILYLDSFNIGRHRDWSSCAYYPWLGGPKMYITHCQNSCHTPHVIIHFFVNQKTKLVWPYNWVEPTTTQWFLVCNLITKLELDEIWKTTSIFLKWKMISIFWNWNGRQPIFFKMMFVNWRWHHKFFEIEDNVNLIGNVRQHQYSCYWKTTSIFLLLEDAVKKPNQIKGE